MPALSDYPIFELLVVWTPYLLDGFLLNILVSVIAMVIGTPIGVFLAWLRHKKGRVAPITGQVSTAFMRNIPTFAFLFYLAFLFPREFQIMGASISIPPWFLASLSLSIAVAGFVSDNFLIALERLERGAFGEAVLFLLDWTSYFIIILMASGTASAIGVKEIVARANIVVGATGDSSMMLWVYAYAMAWFLFIAWPMMSLMQNLKKSLGARVYHLRQKKENT